MTSTACQPRSLLYVPGDRPDRIAKALASEADAVIVDLEDAVAWGKKEEARANATEAIASAPAKPVSIRVNGVVSGLTEEDVRAVHACQTIRLPKTEAPSQVIWLAGLLDELGSDAAIDCLLESALGVENAFTIATAHPRVKSIALGEADLQASLCVYDERALAYGRGRCVVAARAASLPPPSASPYLDLDGEQGLRDSTLEAKALGFFGRAAIHPVQVATINDVFTPSEGEVAAARALIAEGEEQRKTGRGAFRRADGRFVDAAVVETARLTLALAARAEERIT